MISNEVDLSREKVSSSQGSNKVKVAKQVEATNDVITHASTIRAKLKKQIEENRKVYIQKGG